MIALSLAIAIGCFVGVWIGVAVALDHLPTLGWRSLNWLINLFGLAGVAFLSWLLFPAVVTIVTSLFLDRVAAAVEALDYPGRGPPRRPLIREGIMLALRLMLVSIVLNLLSLPIYALVPFLNVALFLALNGYLLGREYFELVASRRLDPRQVQLVRHHLGARIFAGGVMIAAVFAVPIVNLVAPVIATAFMVHVFEGLGYLHACQNLTCPDVGCVDGSRGARFGDGLACTVAVTAGASGGDVTSAGGADGGSGAVIGGNPTA